MELNYLHRKKIVLFYCCCFVISYSWLFFNGWLLHQFKPVIFLNHLDLTLNLLFVTDIQHAVINHFTVQLMLDIIYFLLPLLLIGTVNGKFQIYVAILNTVFNLLYALLLSAFTPLSIAGFVGWIVLPLLFVLQNEKGFYYALHAIRYVFLLIFFSAGLWKLRSGGLFNMEQMSGILLVQHAAYMAQAPADWFSRFLNFLVAHDKLAYWLYFITTMAELFFVIGFFTKKYDNWLVVIFLLFVLFDFFLMRINYFSWVAFMGCFYFSKFKEPTFQKLNLN